MKCSDTVEVHGKLCPSASSGRVFRASVSSSPSAFRVERNRWSISFHPGTSTVLSLGGELVPCTGEHGGHCFVLMGCGHRAEQFGADKVHQLALTFRKAGEALFYKFGRGKDGVVVRYLFAVQNPAHFRGQVKLLGKGQQLQQVRHKMLCCLAHVLGQILAVRAGIGQQSLSRKVAGHNQGSALP